MADDKTSEIGSLEAARLKRRLESTEFRDAQESLVFPIKPGGQCRRCPYFGNLCPAQVISLTTCAEPLSSPSSPRC